MHDAPLSVGQRRLILAFAFMPFVVGLGIALAFRNWMGVVGGIAAFFILIKVFNHATLIVKWRAARAAWG